MTEAPATPLAAGFADPVFDGQRVFRAAMSALARPGSLVPVASTLVCAPLPPAAAALVLALCDYETPVHLAPSVAARPGAGDYIRFHAEATLVEHPAAAAFALLDLAQDALRLADYAQGTAEYPDRSTTVVALASSLAGGDPLAVAGPGIVGEATLRIAGLPPDFAAQWADNRARFPLGVDVIFASDDAILGLPRSSRLVGSAG